MAGNKYNIFSNERDLSVYLCHPDPVWESLLESEGVFWDHEKYPIEITKCAVIILPATSDRYLPYRYLDYLKRGGVAICEKSVLETQYAVYSKTWSWPYDRDTFCGIQNIDDNNTVKIKEYSIGDGVIFRLPFVLKTLWNDYSIARRYIKINGSFRIYEDMASMVKKNVRRVIFDVLKRAFFCQKLPFVNKWYYPGVNRSVFCFRGDADGGKRENITRWLKTVKPFSNCSSIFFCTSAYVCDLDLIRKAYSYGLEVGSHNHYHIIFFDSITNKISISLAERILSNLCYRPNGFVAPAYFYSPSLGPILEENKYLYSSCFGLNHDTFPYFPVVGNKTVNVLEMPFHCLGDRFPRFGVPLKSEVPKRFFQNLIYKKYLSCEPILIYGHPDIAERMGTTPGLIRTIIKSALSYSDVKPMNLSEYALWWRKRHNSRFSFVYSNQEDALKCTISNKGPDDIMIHVEYPQNDHYLFNGNKYNTQKVFRKAMIKLTDIKLPSPHCVGEIVKDKYENKVSFLNKKGVKRFLKAYLDFYLKLSIHKNQVLANKNIPYYKI